MNKGKDQHKERGYNFSGILYPEHFCNNRQIAVDWLKETFQAQGAIGPLHDSDLQDDDKTKLKKEHWHYVLHFQQQHSCSTLRKLLGDKGLIQTCMSLATMCRYFFHMDDDDKFPYNHNDYQTFYNFNFQKQITAFEDFDNKIETIMMVITINNIRSIPDLLYFLYHSEKHRYLLAFASQRLFFIREFLKAMDYEKIVDNTELKKLSEYNPVLQPLLIN